MIMMMMKIPIVKKRKKVIKGMMEMMMKKIPMAKKKKKGDKGDADDNKGKDPKEKDEDKELEDAIDAADDEPAGASDS
jgi:hypothetical protein